MLRLIIGALVGGAIGAAIGMAGSCTSGTCPFTTTWWGGALFGALFGLVIANTIGGAPSTPSHLANVLDLKESTAFTAELGRAGDKTVLVDFYLDTCPPCRALMPELYALAEERADSLVVLKVNAGTHRALAGEFDVQSVPTLVLVRGGETVARQTGFLSAEQLGGWIDSAAAATP